MKEITENTAGQTPDNIHTSYSAQNPDHPDWFIYEYNSLRKILVRVDSESGKVEFLKEL